MGGQGSGRGSWRVARRIAGRELGRAKARSALIATMVGVPVLLITGTVILARTWGLSPEEAALRSLGAADARVTAEGREPVVQDFAGQTRPAAEVTDAGDEQAESGGGHATGDPADDDPEARDRFTRSRLPMVRRIA